MGLVQERTRSKICQNLVFNCIVLYIIHMKIYRGKNPRIKNRTFYPLFLRVKFALDIIDTFCWPKNALSWDDAVTAAVIRLTTIGKNTLNQPRRLICRHVQIWCRPRRTSRFFQETAIIEER